MSLLKKINIAIAGATGFVGLDLINILTKSSPTKPVAPATTTLIFFNADIISLYHF